MSVLQKFSETNIADPTNAQFQGVADKQKREMGGTFDQVFSTEVYGEGVRRMKRKRANLDAMMSRLKPSPWTVLNLMPFPLNVNGVLHSQLAGKNGNQVPACPVGKLYEHKLISEVLYSIKDEGAGMDNLDNYNPEPWDPQLLAKDYENEFLKRMGCGGVVIYEGAEEPEKCGKMHLVEEARKERNQWLLRKVQEAEAEWSDTSGRGRKNITELHRKAAEVLLHEKVLKAQPAWLLATNADAAKAPQLCSGCGEMSEPGAVICKHCRYVFDPLRAYQNTMIEYGHIAMTRLTTEQWKEANQIKADREKNQRQGEAKQLDVTENVSPSFEEATSANDSPVESPSSPTPAPANSN